MCRRPAACTTARRAVVLLSWPTLISRHDPLHPRSARRRPGRSHRHPSRHPSPSRDRLRGSADRPDRGRQAHLLGHRGASRPGHHRRRRHAEGQSPRPEDDRPARRHGRSASAGEERLRLRFAGSQQDACLRPRRAHHDATGRGQAARGGARFRRHRPLHLPARRGRPRWRARDDRGRPVREVPVRCGLRHAQHAGLPGRSLRHPHRPDARLVRQLGSRLQGYGRPRRHARPRHRPDLRGRTVHRGGAGHRRPQRAVQPGGRVERRPYRRRHAGLAQRDPVGSADPRHRPQLLGRRAQSP